MNDKYNYVNTRYYDDDYRYVFDNILEGKEEGDKEISKAISIIRTCNKSLEIMYSSLTKEEKETIMRLILNDPGLL